jgi:predicted metal-dependent hydrolase
MGVSKKSGNIAALIEQFRGQELDPHYLGYFQCFNRQQFYEAHDVLEELWLPVRRTPEGDFFKGLIQLAGAFVHLQKNRLKPAAALFRLAAANLKKYPLDHHALHLPGVLRVIQTWLEALESQDFLRNPLLFCGVPELHLTRARIRTVGSST